MLRVPLSLAVLLSALFALTAVAEAAETWEPADKQAFGTAHDVRSKVWFTLGPTGMGEAYWPRIDRPAVRSLDLKVGGRSESDLATGQVTPADPRSLTPRQVVTARDGAWRITKTYVTDPARDVVLVDMDVRSLNGRPLHLSTDLRAGLDKDRRAQTALLARPALRDVDGVRGTHVTLALGLGRTERAAQDAASASLQQGFPALSASYAKGWHDYLDSLPPRPAAAAPYAALYDTSLMVLAASEDKTYRGASSRRRACRGRGGRTRSRSPPASTTSCGRATSTRWPPPSWRPATAPAAERALDFLLSASRSPTAPSRRTPRSTARSTGRRSRWTRSGMPIVLAWQLGRTDARTLAKVRLAGEYLVKHGPLTGQERWENQRGWSPATIAAEIAGLVTGADLARRTGDAATAARWEATADAWQRSVQAWTATTNGPLSTGPYYLRVTKDRAPNRATTTTSATRARPPPTSAASSTRASSTSCASASSRRRPGHRELRARRRRPAEGHRASGRSGTASPTTATARRPPASRGRSAKPDTFKTYGRAWPLLAGERGEYELARPAGDAGARLMAAAAGSGLMLPEQVWDGRPPSSGAAATPGKGTLSATPLAWSHAQFVRLALLDRRGRAGRAPGDRGLPVRRRLPVVARAGRRAVGASWRRTRGRRSNLSRSTVLGLVAMGVAVLVIANDFTALSVALPAIERDLDAELSTVQWVINAYALTFGVLIVTGGRLADAYGRRRAFVAGAAIFAGFSALGGAAQGVVVAPDLPRALMGIGGALMWPAILGMTYAVTPRSRAGLAGGIILGAAGLGNAVGPLLGGALTDALSAGGGSSS